MRLFTEHGYAGVSMRQIAAEVGVQAGALYLYTPNKQSLLFELLLEQMRGAVDALNKTDLTGTPDAQIEAFVRAHFQYHMSGAHGMFIPYTELRSLTSANYKRLEEMRRIYERELEEIIRAGHASGAFEAPDSKLSTLVIISILNGVLAWYRPDGRVPLGEVEAHYVSVVKKALSAL
ncbi:MAG: TetR/AcrR family transcriptional regulator [Pseudomonadota bacterium]